MQLTVTDDMDSYQDALGELVMDGKTVALVPTMGALHGGHMALIKQAKELADAVVVSIFVNPKQFGPHEDFAKYPRMLEQDLRAIDEAGATIAYTPGVEDLYPEGFTTGISAGQISTILEGASRPGHFDGVATVVTKLLLRTLPHVAIFGEKDYQQLCVIRRIARDLDLTVDIVGAPTVREADGLALSSRNAYLMPQQRAIAPKLHETLRLASHEIKAGKPVLAVLEQGVAVLDAAGFKVDYLELRENDTLDKIEQWQGDARLLVAATLGTTRLIDNIEMD